MINKIFNNIGFLISLIFILIGILYIYFSNLVLKFYEYFKKYILNEKIVIFYRKKIGFIFILLGMIIFILAMKEKFVNKNKLYLAYQSFYSKNFSLAEKYCFDILSENPNNISALELLGKIYIFTEKYNNAKNIFLKIKNLNPQKQQLIEKYIAIINSRLNK